jgi:hypothetical protein
MMRQLCEIDLPPSWGPTPAARAGVVLRRHFPEVLGVDALPDPGRPGLIVIRYEGAERLEEWAKTIVAAGVTAPHATARADEPAGRFLCSPAS